MQTPQGTRTAPLPLAVSIGEPAGIGADTLLNAWQSHLAGHIDALPALVVLADPDALMRRAAQLGLPLELERVSAARPFASAQTQLPVIALDNPLIGDAGAPCPADSAGIVEAISTAVEMVRNNQARAVVTLPINKKSLYDTGFDFPGHTEFLGALAQQWPDQTEPVRPVMMLAGPQLRAVPVTIHIALKDVPPRLNIQDIIATTLITAHDLTARFGIANPRIAIAGLNPHAGEGGAMGLEEQQIIGPAIEALKGHGIDCFGPLPADTMFHPAARAGYDAAVCMYHDQALIPAKALDFDETVNVTLGLPFVRTSPDHGTAYDIAGSGKANPTSTIAALRLAAQMTAATAAAAAAAVAPAP